MYNDCSAEMVDKTVSFEYLYYPGKWLAKGYENNLAALWKPKKGINGKDLYSPEQGYIWCIQGGEDGSIYLQTLRPGYENYFLIGYVRTTAGKHIKVFNMAAAVRIQDKKQYHETFAFRIFCQDCSTKQKCILWRLHDEYKFYSDKSGYLRMCRECGSDDWFNWHVFVHNNTNLRCPMSSKAHEIFRLNLFKKPISITSVIILFYLYYTAR